MADTQKGIGVVWGVGSIVATGCVINTTTRTGLPQGADFTYESDSAQLTNEDGEVVGMAFYNARGRYTFTIVPSSDAATPSEAEALTNQDAMLVAPGTLMTLTTDGASTVPIGLNSGKYLVEQSRLRRTNTGPTLIEVDVFTYSANDVTATVS